MSADAPVVTGFYRYTDIWFQWAEFLAPEEKDPLKAILAHDSLVHPDHPLHIDGVEGVSMHIGTFQDGQSRLLFSSAQIDYIRYWLHKMGLTTNIIPLPYSECLLTRADLSTVSPVTYKTGGELRGAIKKIDKNNKRLKNSNNPFLTNRREAFERVRSLWNAKTGTWCALDFEEWERDHSIITEFGYSRTQWENGKEVEESAHYIVKEHMQYRNGQYVAENRMNYKFGTTVQVSKALFKKTVSDLITTMCGRGPVFLIFHNPSGDIKTLRRLEAPINSAIWQLPEKTPTEGIFIIDTALLFGALEGEGTNTRALQQVCNHLKVPNFDSSLLHNAGNDAYYTLCALRKMASGEPLDTLREQLWPNQTKDGVKVQFRAYEEDSDFSDQEGVMGIYAPSAGVGKA